MAKEVIILKKYFQNLLDSASYNLIVQVNTFVTVFFKTFGFKIYLNF